MKRLTAITALCLLFSTAFVAGKGSVQPPEWPDSLRSVYLYTEGIKQNAITRDSVRARELFLEAIRHDSLFAPAYYELGVSGMYASPDEAVELARTAYRMTRRTAGTTSSTDRRSSSPNATARRSTSTAVFRSNTPRSRTTTACWRPSMSRTTTPTWRSRRSTRPRCASGAFPT